MTNLSKLNFSSRQILLVVILLSLIISVFLAVATWDINFWPTDARVYYFDATVELPNQQYLSQIHESMDAQNVRWLHGKEILILCASLLQRLMNDTVTLRPFILLGIISFFFASLLIYLIAVRWWGTGPALVCYASWVTSFWPYVYILFAKHQPLGAVFFLLAVFVAQRAEGKRFGMMLYLLSGICMALSLFSSPASSLYVPFFVAAFFYGHAGRQRTGRTLLKWIFIDGAAVVLGVLGVLIYINWPHVIAQLKGYWDYVHISGSYSHFYYNQPYLQRWFKDVSLSVHRVRGGWPWVLGYFRIIMPVLFPVYLLGGAAAVGTALKKKGRERIVFPGMLALSLTPVVMAEAVHVAQYGGNYFPAFLGVVMFLGFTSFWIVREGYWPGKQGASAVFIRAAFIGLCAAHIVTNVYILFDDVYPSRMATTFLSRKFKELKVTKVSTYVFHPHREPFTDFLAPDLLEKISFSPLQYCVMSPDAPVLVPPLTGDSIYIAAISTYYDFDRDMLLNQIREKDLWDEFALFSVKTLASSRIWLHEEEILSYRKIIMGHALPADERLTRAWILDGEKLAAQKERLIPPPQVLYQHKARLRRIGDGTGLYAYKGFIAQVNEEKDLNKIGAFIQKQGSPDDELRAYVYRVDDNEKMWVPAGEHFISLPLLSNRIPPQGKVFPVVFRLPRPLRVKPGKYFIQIIRTGQDNPSDHYLILNQPLAFQ